jgi:hypothetical protein
MELGLMTAEGTDGNHERTVREEAVLRRLRFFLWTVELR